MIGHTEDRPMEYSIGRRAKRLLGNRPESKFIATLPGAEWTELAAPRVSGQT